jgi:hypothetical protein
MDQDNPAVSRQLTVPPSVLEEIGEDPKVLQGYTRKMLMTQLVVIHEKLRDLNTPIATRMQFAELLAKNSDLPTTPKVSQAANAGANDPKFSVQIVFSGAPQSQPLPRAQVVEAEPATLTSKQAE